MYINGTGLLTDAMHDSRGACRFPSQCLASVEGGWLAFTQQLLSARITVAGQWRNLTALPEHSESGQVVGLNGRLFSAVPQGKRVRFKSEAWNCGSQNEYGNRL